jgi:hypothetical protein
LNAGPLWSSRLFTSAFLLFVLSIGIPVSFLLFQEGKGWVLLIALATGALLWGWEQREAKLAPALKPIWNRQPGYLAAAAIITIVTLVACLPSLHTYFLVDDFAFIHRFQTLTMNQFLQLLHTDLGWYVWGDVRQELRPLYSLYYVSGYHLWGLDPLGYHLSDIFLHLVNALLVVLIAKDLAPGDSRRAIFVANSRAGYFFNRGFRGRKLARLFLSGCLSVLHQVSRQRFAFLPGAFDLCVRLMPIDKGERSHPTGNDLLL